VLEKIVKQALKKGADRAEVFYQSSKNFDYSTVKDKLEKISFSSEEGFGLRVIIGKKVGFAYTTNNTKKLVEDAIRICKNSKALESEPTFPNKLDPGKTVFDKRFLNLSEKDCHEIIKRALDGLKKTKAKPVEVSFSYTFDHFGIANSEGISCEDSSTSVVLSLEARVENSTFSDFQYSRKLDIRPEKLGEEVGIHAEDSSKAKMIKGGKEILLYPKVFSGLLTFTILPSFFANNVQKHQSLFENKLNKKILSKRITFVDNGLLQDGFRTFKFDGEGASPSKKFVVKEGVLKTFLYDCYTAVKEGKDTTGNALRENFKSVPSISHTNLLMEGENGSFEDLIAQIKDGLYVRSILGAFLSNPTTADFSVKLDLGYEIKNGEIVRPVKNVMLAGNMLEILEGPLMISKKTLLAGSPTDALTYGTSGQILPWISTDLIKVS
jgi:PmbA protein